MLPVRYSASGPVLFTPQAGFIIRQAQYRERVDGQNITGTPTAVDSVVPGGFIEVALAAPKPALAYYAEARLCFSQDQNNPGPIFGQFAWSVDGGSTFNTDNATQEETSLGASTAASNVDGFDAQLSFSSLRTLGSDLPSIVAADSDSLTARLYVSGNVNAKVVNSVHATIVLYEVV